MKNLLLNCMLFDWFKAKASNPEEASAVTSVDFNPKELQTLEEVKEPSTRFQIVSSFLTKHLLSHQEVCSLDLSTFSPSEIVLDENATAGSKRSKFWKDTRLGNRLEKYHLDKRDGALQACSASVAKKDVLALPTFPSLVYLYYLRNTLSYLKKSENLNPNLKPNLADLNSTLDAQIVGFNEKNHKTKLKAQLFTYPTVDTNIDLLANTKNE